MAKRKSRIYTRVRGGEARYYGDFRDFADVGGGQEALKPKGATTATTDADLAASLASDRVRELERLRRNKNILGIEKEASLEAFAAHHLIEKSKEAKVTEGWLGETQKRLAKAVAYFGAETLLDAISVADTEAYCDHLRQLDNGRGGTISKGTQRHYLNALSNLFRRAQAKGYVQPGYNPVSALMEKPTANRREARWLEVHEAALLLEAARVYRPEPPHNVHPHLHAILATFLLTGGRKNEVLGLTAEDVSFDRGTVTFRPNEHRGLKTATSHRSVPLHPQLREILQEHVFGGGRVSGLLFPSESGDGMINDLRKSLDGVAQVAGFDAGDIRTKAFRHTYCAATLQLLDRGAPVSPWTVARWMGHGGQSLVNRVYGHLGDLRHRSEVLEYRAEQHVEALGDRLRSVRAWTPPRCRHGAGTEDQCGVRGNLSADDLCLWHDPKRAKKARAARPHAAR